MAIHHDAPLLRRNEILLMLKAAPKRALLAEALATQFGCCERTIRRDARWLEARQLGVTMVDGVLSYTPAQGSSTIEPEDALMARIATAQMLGINDPKYRQSIAADAKAVTNLFGHRLELFRFIGQDAHRRDMDAAVYRSLIWAVHAGRSVKFKYRARSRGTERSYEVDPQALRQWRDSMYLVATQNGCCKVFSIDRISEVETTGVASHRLTEEELELNVSMVYGVFAGVPEDWAVIEMDPASAEYADARWHKNERRAVLPDGRVELTVPYASTRELIATVLSLGPGARVVSPPELAQDVAAQAKAIAERYAA